MSLEKMRFNSELPVTRSKVTVLAGQIPSHLIVFSREDLAEFTCESNADKHIGRKLVLIPKRYTFEQGMAVLAKVINSKNLPIWISPTPVWIKQYLETLKEPK